MLNLSFIKSFNIQDYKRMGKRMKWEFDLDQKSARSKFNILMKTPEELIMKIIMECVHIKHFMRYKTSLKTLKRKEIFKFSQ